MSETTLAERAECCRQSDEKIRNTDAVPVGAGTETFGNVRKYPETFGISRNHSAAKLGKQSERNHSESGGINRKESVGISSALTGLW